VTRLGAAPRHSNADDFVSVSVRRTVGFVAYAPDGEIGTLLQKPRSINTILPVNREWIIALSIDDGMLAAFDSQTLDPLFEGRYFAPKKYGRRDPRRWTSRTFEKLKWEYGIYGGTRFQGTTFVIAEVAVLRALMQTCTPGELKELHQMPLVDALAAGRQAWAEATNQIEEND
jgi:hypothetical protein